MTPAWAFDAPVARHGYRWWYLDALSEDGQHGITVIAFIGTVFSPWYAWSRRWGEGAPENHCCLNVALYGRPSRWAMTDRRRSALVRSTDHLQIGPSSLSWDGEQLLIEIEDSHPDKFVHVPVAGLQVVRKGNDTDLSTTMTKEQLNALPAVDLTKTQGASGT